MFYTVCKIGECVSIGKFFWYIDEAIEYAEMMLGVCAVEFCDGGGVETVWERG